MSESDALADLKKDRDRLAGQLQTLDGGQLQLGPPASHEARLHWIRGQIVALDIAIRKIEASHA